MDFSDSDSSFSSLSGADGAIDDLDDQLFGGLSKKQSVDIPTKSDEEPLRKKTVSFDNIGKTSVKTSSNSGILKPESAPAVIPTPVKNSLDDFLNEFDDDDPLGGLLSDSEPIAAKPKVEPVSSKPVISKSVSSKPAIPAPVEAKPKTDFSFSEDDSLLDLKPKKSVPKTAAKVASSSSTAKSRPSTTGGLFDNATSIPGFSDDESELTLTLTKSADDLILPDSGKVNQPGGKKQEGKSDDSWLANLLGEPKKEPSPEPAVKNVAKVDAMLASDEDDTLNIISKQPKKMSKMVPKSVTKQVTKSGPLPTEAHRHELEQHRPSLEQARQTLDHHRPNLDHRPDLDTINNLNDEVIRLKQQVHEQQTRNIEKMQTQQDTSHVLDQARHNANLAERSRLEAVQKCTDRIRDADLEHKSHINRLKQTHMETIQLLKDEKDAQLQRLKTIHTDELDAFKTASSTTRDVKELLISVTTATSSLKDIAHRVEESNEKSNNHSELINEMVKLKSAIQMERKCFEAERERMGTMVQEMMRYNREQKELSQTERFRLDSEIQRIDTERRLLEEEKRKLETEIQVKGQENLRYKNSLLEEQKRQMEQMAQTKQKIASEWAEIQKAKQSLFDIVKPDAFAKYEENVRQSAADAANAKSIRRELESKERMMGEKRDDMEQEKKLLRIERDELTRQKNQLRREEESIKTRYADFISDTAEGRTALEAAKRIEIRANDKLKDADAALKTLKHERDLLRQERSAVESLHRNDFQMAPTFQTDLNLSFNPTCDAINDSFNRILLDDPIKTLQMENPDLFIPLQYH